MPQYMFIGKAALLTRGHNKILVSVEQGHKKILDSVEQGHKIIIFKEKDVVVVVLFYVHGKHLRSCRDGQLT